MRLIHKKTGLEIGVGDIVALDNQQVKILHAPKPHSPASSGKVTVMIRDNLGEHEVTYYAGVFGLEWIEREDR